VETVGVSVARLVEKRYLFDLDAQGSGFFDFDDSFKDVGDLGL